MSYMSFLSFRRLKISKYNLPGLCKPYYLFCLSVDKTTNKPLNTLLIMNSNANEIIKVFGQHHNIHDKYRALLYYPDHCRKEGKMLCHKLKWFNVDITTTVYNSCDFTIPQRSKNYGYL